MEPDDPGSDPGSVLSSCLSRGKFLLLLKPQVLHLQGGDHNSKDLRCMQWNGALAGSLARGNTQGVTGGCVEAVVKVVRI